MIAWRTLVASRMMPVARRVPACSRTKASTAACSRSTARAPTPFGTTCSTTTFAPKRLARSRLMRIASSACGPPRTGTRIESHVLEAALLDDRDVARRLAHDRVDRRAEHRSRQSPLAGEHHLGVLGLGPCGLRRRRRSAPAEDDEVAALLADRLDHAVGGMAADADQRPQLDPLLVAEVEHALEEAARGPRLGRALGEADALGHLDDAECGDLGRAPIGDAGTDAHEVARRPRVRERQEDAVRRLAPGRRHQLPAPFARAACQRATR